MRLIIIATSIVFALFVWLGGDDENTQVEKRPTTDTCEISADGGVEDTMAYFGDVITDIQLQPSFRIAGKIENI